MSYRIFIDSSFRTILHFQLREKIFTQSFCLERKKNLGRLLKSCRKGVCVCVFMFALSFTMSKNFRLFFVSNLLRNVESLRFSISSLLFVLLESFSVMKKVKKSRNKTQTCCKTNAVIKTSLENYLTGKSSTTIGSRSSDVQELSSLGLKKIGGCQWRDCSSFHVKFMLTRYLVL